MVKKMKGKWKTNQEGGKHGLLDIVFSWTSKEILNKYLYNNKVKKIPMVFPSSEDYLNSFKVPLVEETHADLTSNMKTIAKSPAFEITSIEFSINFKPREDLLYVLQPKSIQDIDNKALNYEPEFGDLIVITNVWPVNDLLMLDGDYTIALVKSVGEDYPGVEILASKPFLFEQDMHNATKDIQSMYATYLINLTTNLRIWKALHLDLNGENASLIKTVLRPAWMALENCAIRTVKKKCSVSAPDLETMLRPFNLNNSQLEAVFSCIATRDDSSTKHNIKLIWGPPGTGKTKTVGSLLFVLLRIKCRTLVCAPTNTAVLEVAGRVLKLVRDSLQIEYGNYGLGDLVLLGNGKRMKVHDRDDQIVDIFLSERIKILEDCLAPLNGWKDSLKSMIALLEDPEDLYRLYLESCVVRKQEDIHEDEEAETDGRRLQDKTDKGLKNINVQTIRKGKMKLEDAELFTNNSGTKNAGNKEGDALSFEKFIRKRFISISGNLKFCIVGLYSHLPTSSITLKVVKRMITACDLLESLKTLLHDVYTGNEEIKEIFGTKNETKGIKRISNDATLTGLARMRKIKEDCLMTLTFLRDRFNVPKGLDKVHLDCGAIVNFCMANALFIFSTVSSSIKLHTPRMKKIELLVIDEAAQLKECESVIPLQLPGVRRAILIGDERQLSAIVKSEICEKADFGRSLFQRLVALGHKKHLLNVQYRMHPSISFFPNKVFYYNEILDAPMVKSPNYSRDYLGGKIFGSYSFINISHRQEESGYGRSLKNSVEVAVISELVAQLFEESMSMKRMTSVGIISPYNAQVLAIQDKLGNTYTKNNIDSETYFSLSVRSIDGFQGGEEDLIIMSTVRCNDEGLIGFLSNRQRTNVALTRARYCLWILGNEPTLINSNSVWGTLVADAKNRKCFHNANEDSRLDRAITNCLIELNRFDILPEDCYPLFRSARWKVSFSDEFRQTMVDTNNIKTRRQVFSLLVKLSTGWRDASKESQNINVTRGNISQLLELYKVCISDDFDESMIKTYDIETLGQVFSLLQKLSTGWRNAGKASQNNIVKQGENSQLLELYKVNELLYIAWTEEILEEDSDAVPVLKFWDLLPVTQLSKLRKRLDMLRSEFTYDTSFDNRNLEVPLKWPAKVNDADKKKLPQAKLEQLLLKPMASLDISNEPGESSTSYRVDNKKKNGKDTKKSSLKWAVRTAQSVTHLGHVVNVPAEPINGGGEITASELQLVESSSQHTVRAAPKKKQVKKAGNKS